MLDLVEKVGRLLVEKEMKIAVAESCTGGLLAAALTHKPGSSRYFDCGFITYSNDSKISLLGVPEQMITMNGAVSAQVAESMAKGALKNSQAHLAVSITGTAGPGGGSEKKPVGTVHFGFALKKGSSGSLHEKFEGTREQIRSLASVTAMKYIIEILESEKKG